MKTKLYKDFKTCPIGGMFKDGEDVLRVDEVHPFKGCDSCHYYDDDIGNETCFVQCLSTTHISKLSVIAVKVEV